MKKRIFTVIIMTLVTIFGLQGCAKTESKSQDKTAVCFVIFNGANSMGVNLNSNLVQKLAEDAVSGFGYVSVINADGNPELVIANDYDIDERFKKASKEKLRSDAQIKTKNLLLAMQETTADDPEIDYLESLELAVRSLSPVENCQSKTIVVIGSGLSTTGLLNFQNNIFASDYETVADMLESLHAIPDFSGVNVCWQQIGDVAYPQHIEEYQRNELKEFWREIIERGGGKVVYDDTLPNKYAENADYPAVSTVTLPSIKPIQFDALSVEHDDLDGSDNLFETPKFLSEEQVAFSPGLSTYINPDEAEAVIQPIGDYLLSHSDTKLLLAGTIAGDDCSDTGYNLSLNRAEMVRSTLIDYGINPDQLICKGLGSGDPWHVYGAGYTGELAAQNRKVVLIDADTDLAKEILSGLE